MSLLVGVTTYTPAGEDKKGYSLPCEYVDALAAAGADVVLLPPATNVDLLSRLDGLVLAGGGDLDPATYSGSLHETIYMVDPRRDEFELGLLERALRYDMPVFAICRGMQVLNVHLGGTLLAHVPERYGETVLHRLPPREPVAHPVTISPRSRLAGFVGCEATVEVISWHHQAIDVAGEGLRVVARAADGLPEAVETDAGTWVFGVQWHPELNAARERSQAALFDEFTAACRRYAGSETR